MSADPGAAFAAIKVWEWLRSDGGGPQGVDEHLDLLRRCRLAVDGRRDMGGDADTGAEGANEFDDF